MTEVDFETLRVYSTEPNKFHKENRRAEEYTLPRVSDFHARAHILRGIVSGIATGIVTGMVTEVQNPKKQLQQATRQRGMDQQLSEERSTRPQKKRNIIIQERLCSLLRLSDSHALVDCGRKLSFPARNCLRKGLEIEYLGFSSKI